MLVGNDKQLEGTFKTRYAMKSYIYLNSSSSDLAEKEEGDTRSDIFFYADRINSTKRV